MADNISEAFLKPVVAAYKKRMEVLIAELEKNPDLEFLKPSGAFYLFVNISKVLPKLGLSTDIEFCERLLTQKKTATTPGTSFGMPGWVRLSFAASDEEVKTGGERFSELCRGV